MKLDKKLQARVVPPVPLANSMDGPSVSWTVGDLFKFNNKVFLTYHCMGSGYDFLTPVGCLLGATILPRMSKFSHLTPLQAAGTGGIVAGGAGMGLGLLALVGTATSKNPKIPWTNDGIQMRVDGLSHNYKVRALDLGVWVGIAAAGGALLYSGGSMQKFGLLPGLPGQLQTVALGSAAGSIGATILIQLTK